VNTTPVSHVGAFLAAAMACLGLAATAWSDAPAQVLTAYVVLPVDQAPTLDGKLDDPCWRSLPREKTFYKFGTLKAAPAPFSTTMQLGYDRAGVYVGLWLDVEDMSQLVANITNRDAGHIWHDDSVELYFDRTATAIGFRKFTVNALGTQADLFRMDPANIDMAWSPMGWRVATDIRKNGWGIELFFPWEDLGGPAKPGDLWRFALIRFERHPKFAAGTWSLGAMYTAPERFGWLLFAEDRPEPQRLAKLLAARVPGNWILPVGEQVILNGPKAPTVVSTADFLAKVRQEAAGWLARLRKQAPEQGNAGEAEAIEQLAQRLNQVPAAAAGAVELQQHLGQLRTIAGDAEERYYQQRLKDLYRRVREAEQD